MKATDLKIGVTYHNGKEGPRSYSARKILKMNAQYFEPFTGRTWYDGIEYEQVEGRYKGGKSVLSAVSFAKWAKGEVEEEEAK
ncbi:hypothetical protein D1872_203670 [compost metagenome]